MKKTYRYKIGTLREFAEELADKTYYGNEEITEESKELPDFLFFDEVGLTVDEATDVAIEDNIGKANLVWYGTQYVYMFDCNYICFGEWGGDSGVAITSPDDMWYAEESRETYVKSIMDKVLEVEERSWKERDNTMIIWE